MRSQLITEQSKKRVLRHSIIIASLVFAWASLPTAEASAQACTPECRDGYTCHRGECISACNPGCGEGEVCSADGECLSAVPTQNVRYRTVVLEDNVKPNVKVPATFVALGGLFMIAGGVTFGTAEYDYFGYWTGGHYAGLGLMTLGAISLISATPLLAIRVRDKQEWERRTSARHVQELSVAPHVSPGGRSKQYGLALRGRF